MTRPQNSSFTDYLEFENLIHKLLQAKGYSVTRPVGGIDTGVDFIANKKGEAPKLVQVKWTKRPDLPLHSLRDWAASTGRFGAENGEPLLIASGYVENNRREWGQAEFNITIWDRSDVLRLAEGLPINAEFQKLFESAATQHFPGTQPLAAPIQAEPDSPPEDPPSETKGDDLAEALDAVKLGKQGAKQYERVCEEIISYLFGDDLVDPRVQSRSDDKLSIVDIVYRVKAESSFWNALTRDFRARVIVFECKNYRGPVGPMQVFTTERYMSVAALRPVCFVLSRTRAHKHARVAAQGALRETGKLLIFLDDALIKQMLKERDVQILGGKEKWVGNGPTEILDQEIYDFLATMPR